MGEVLNTAPALLGPALANKRAQAHIRIEVRCRARSRGARLCVLRLRGTGPWPPRACAESD
jgi:hypothetical protein